MLGTSDANKAAVVICGNDASFELYEDSGDGYAYEHAARATIHFQWDDRHRMLSIGNRSGNFSGMLARRTFRIVLVKPGHGAGDESGSVSDQSVTYDGGSLKIDLGKKGTDGLRIWAPQDPPCHHAYCFKILPA